MTNCADCALLSLAIDELVSAETGSQTEREIERQAGCQFVSQSTLFARGCFLCSVFLVLVLIKLSAPARNF